MVLGKFVPPGQMTGLHPTPTPVAGLRVPSAPALHPQAQPLSPHVTPPPAAPVAPSSALSHGAGPVNELQQAFARFGVGDYAAQKTAGAQPTPVSVSAPQGTAQSSVIQPTGSQPLTRGPLPTQHGSGEGSELQQAFARFGVGDNTGQKTAGAQPTSVVHPPATAAHDPASGPTAQPAQTAEGSGAAADHVPPPPPSSLSESRSAPNLADGNQHDNLMAELKQVFAARGITQKAETGALSHTPADTGHATGAPAADHVPPPPPPPSSLSESRSAPNLADGNQHDNLMAELKQVFAARGITEQAERVPEPAHLDGPLLDDTSPVTSHTGDLIT